MYHRQPFNILTKTKKFLSSLLFNSYNLPHLLKRYAVFIDLQSKELQSKDFIFFTLLIFLSFNLLKRSAYKGVFLVYITDNQTLITVNKNKNFSLLYSSALTIFQSSETIRLQRRFIVRNLRKYDCFS